ncbi:DUF2029 domain-containing protein [Candidatus Woesearchaeota archaeon]|nr:DUF2029 domain-containing protein [Candidatus Woesearchaeota archaeon]
MNGKYEKLLIISFVLIVSFLSFARSFSGLIGVLPWHLGYSDIFNEDRISPSTALKIPYVEKPVEYPIIIGFFIYLMWLFGKSLLGYALLSFVFLTLASIITALTLYKLCGLLNIEKGRIWVFFVFAPSMIAFGIFNWDMLAVMFAVLAIYYYCKNKRGWAALFLALGFNAKLFPVLILPFMLLKTDYKNRIKMLLIFLFVSLALNLYFAINSYEVWKNIFTFHSLREPNIDSIWYLAGLKVGFINRLSTALYSAAYLLLLYYHKKLDVVKIIFISLMLFLLFTKVFSPQYLLWILPFFVLICISKVYFYILELANIAVFFFTTYWLVGLKQPLFLYLSHFFVIVRTLVLVYILYSLLNKHKFAIFTKTKNI